VLEVSVEKMEHKHVKQDPPQESGQESVDLEERGQGAVEREQWATEKAALEDRLLRSHSDFQNLRRRTEQQRIEVYDSATAEALRSLLPMLDDFERGLRIPAADKEHVKEYVAGIELIYSRFAETLKKLGLEPMDSKGQPFDPQIHHAVDMVETEDAPDHTILEEYERGYNFKGRLLRPAKVKVAVQPASK
jgi:molecular chaperone GrpE